MFDILQNCKFIYNYSEDFFLFTFEILFPELILFICVLSLLFLKPHKNKLKSYNYWFFELWKFSILTLIVYSFLKLLQLQKYSDINIFLFNNFWFEDNFIIILKLILILCMFLTLSFTFFYYIFINNKKIKLRIIFFLMFTVFFLFGLLMAFDLFGIYLCIEGLTLVLTSLIASNLTRLSIESGLKYTLLSAFTSCFLLLSIGLFLFFFGTTNILTLKILSNSNLLNPIYNFFFFSLNLIFLKNLNYLLIFFFLNLFFKLAAWPCCFWVPDIYGGLTMPIIFYFSTTIKLIFFLFFIRFVFFTFFSYYFFIKTLFTIIALGTSIFGVIGSIFQNKIKLFIAFSGITHIGLIFFSLSSFNYIGVFSAIFYIFFYTLVIFLLFGILLNLHLISYNKLWGIKKLPILYISDLKGIYLKQKICGLLLIVIFLFLSGVPPFISFFGKFWIYLTLYLDKQYYILILMFFLAMISTFYYLWWIRSFIFDIDTKNTKIKYFNILSFEIIDQYYNKYLFKNNWLFSLKLIKILFLLILIFLFLYSPIFLILNIKLILIFSKKLFFLLKLV